MSDLSQNDWRQQLKTDKDAVILDVRTLEEVNELRIPNSIHIDIYRGQAFMDELDQLDKNKNYYVYCKSGGRSAQACAVMQQLGFKATYNLQGGISAWTGETE